MGLWMSLVGGAATLTSRWRLPALLPISGAIVALCGCAILTRGQIRYWKDTETLLRHTIAVTGANCLAWYDLGTCSEGAGHVEEAVNRYRKALESCPEFIRAHNSLADDCARQGQPGEALFPSRDQSQFHPVVPPLYIQ